MFRLQCKRGTHHAPKHDTHGYAQHRSSHIKAKTLMPKPHDDHAHKATNHPSVNIHVGSIA